MCTSYSSKWSYCSTCTRYTTNPTIQSVLQYVVCGLMQCVTLTCHSHKILCVLQYAMCALVQWITHTCHPPMCELVRCVPHPCHSPTHDTLCAAVNDVGVSAVCTSHMSLTNS